MEEDQNYILEELARMFHGTPVGELPHINSYRPEGGTLIYVCADLQSGQWLVKTIDSHKIGSITNAENLPKPARIALWKWNKVSRSQEELLKWIKHLNLRLHTKHWRVLDKAAEPNGQRFILLINRDSYTISKETRYKHFYRSLAGNH
jgi:hypothetical protein